MSTRVTAVIVTFRSAATIADCIGSLAPAAVGCTLRAVVIDNASDDGSVAAARAAAAGAGVPIDLVEWPTNRGFAAASNHGLARADGEMVLFLNPDTVLPPGAVDALVATLAGRPDTGLVSPALINPDGSAQAMVEDDITLGRALRGMVRLGRPVRPRPAPPAGGGPVAVDWVHAACVLLPVPLARRLGGFDERFFFGGEDMDLCRRVREAGFDVVVVPETRVTHVGGASLAAGGTDAPPLRVKATATAFAVRYGRWAAYVFAVAATAVYGLSGRRRQAAAAVEVLRGR